MGGTGAGRGLWPPTGMGRACRVTPAMAGVKGVGKRVQSGGPGTARRFPARAEWVPHNRFSQNDRGQRPAQRARSARHGRDGRRPGALGPRPG
jgi:hypothetical protein